MRILDRTVYIGANVYAHYPVIRLELDLGPLEEWPSARLGERFIAPLLAVLPGLHTHGCSYRTPGGFVRRLREDEGTWMGHILEHVALELQHLAGANVTFGKTRSAGRRGVYHVVYAYEDVEVGTAAGELAERLLRSLIPPELHGGEPDPGFAFAAELAALVDCGRSAASARGAAQRSGSTRPRVVVIAGETEPLDLAARVTERLRAGGAAVGVATGGAHEERAVVAGAVDVAVVATTAACILETGLGVSRCDVAAVIGAPGAEIADELLVPVEIAARSAVLRDGGPAAADAIVRLLDA